MLPCGYALPCFPGFRRYRQIEPGLPAMVPSLVTWRWYGGGGGSRTSSHRTRRPSLQQSVPKFFWHQTACLQRRSPGRPAARAGNGQGAELSVSRPCAGKDRPSGTRGAPGWGSRESRPGRLTDRASGKYSRPPAPFPSVSGQFRYRWRSRSHSRKCLQKERRCRV